MNRTTDAVARFRRVGFAHRIEQGLVGTAPATRGARLPERRGGAVLIVVMALLGTLTFLGFLFYTFAAQEQASGEYFATAETQTADFPASLFEDWFLEQLILGTRPSLGDSALYGSNWAIVPNMIGRPNFDEQLSLANPNNAVGNQFSDVNPFDGLGIGVYANAENPTKLGNGEFVFDYDGDGVADADQDGLNALPAFLLNFSRAANPGPNPWNPPIEAAAFHPDAGYTYPDVNSMFLAFDGFVRDPNNPGNVYRVIIPSFHRPQYFPSLRGVVDGSPTGSNANGFVDVYFDLATANKVLRPHYEHANANNSTFQRFIVPDVPGVSPHPNPFWDVAAQGVSAQSGDTTRIIPPFPFRVDINGDGVSNEAGVWSFPDMTADPNDPSSTIYEFDVDCDGDGFRDAVWMDTDFPIMDLPDGRQFVPLFACKVIDADGLLNVNAHGNMNGVLARQWNGDVINPGDPSATLVHASNQGLGRNEINLGLGLTADPSADLDPTVTLSEAQQQHELNFGPTLANSATPITTPVLSNLELLMLLNGRENLRDDPSAGFVVDSQIEGRWGDDFQIADFYAWIRSGGTFPGAPAPGGYLVDDDGDSNMVGYAPVFSLGNPAYPITLPPGFTPDDDINAPVNFINSGAAAGNPGGGAAYRDANLLGTWVPPFVHPLDYGGTGSGYVDQLGSVIVRRLQAVNGMTNRAALQIGSDNPAAFPTYFGVSPLLGAQNFWQHQFVSTDAEIVTAGIYRNLFGGLPYYRAFQPNQQSVTVGSLQEITAAHDFLRDDGGEVILNRRYRNPEYDAVFPTHEMEGLHLSRQDFKDVGGTSRLRDLAIVNLDKTNENRRREIAGRLTTDSWDRLDFAHGQSVSGTADRDWEFTPWNGTNTEFQTTTGNVAFPPEFTTPVAGSANDPLRPELRLLLKSEFGYNAHLNTTGSDARYPRHRLNINRILSDDTPTAPAAPVDDPDLYAAFDAEENPQFRNLVPHPNMAAIEELDLGGSIAMLTIQDVLHDNSVLPFENFSNLGDVATAGSDAARSTIARAQEWWARYDRQRLARDIYTLLWVLGGPEELSNPADVEKYIDFTAGFPSGTRPYTNVQVLEMAQFAANYVDALDRDDVITRFYYDIDPRDGWNPTGTDFVNGVEAQQLTISEVLWVQTVDTGSDEPSSIWDDDAAREFLYIELRNASPFDVEMRNESWRLSRYATGTVPGTDLPVASFKFTTDPNSNNNVVKSGRTFLIGGHDNSATVMDGGILEVRASDFYVNDGNGPEFDQIIPYRIDGTDASEQALPTMNTEHRPTTLDLDLSYTKNGIDHQNRFEFDGNLTIPDKLVDPTLPTPPVSFMLVLERRTNLRGGGLIDYDRGMGTADDDDWGGWIEVDRFENVTPRPFDASVTPLADQLRNLTSQERKQPLDRLGVNSHAQDTGSPPHSHTLGNPDFTVNGTDDDNASTDRNQGNSNSPPTFDIWQPHFDRDFSSVFELLSVPVIGPHEVTEKLVDVTSKKLTGWYDESVPANRVPALAGARFMDVDPGRNSPGTITDDNRWYRLFEFLTVPDGGDEAIKERLTRLVRTPGKINLNTARGEAVLAALLDDDHIQRFNAVAPFQTTDAFDVNRNWYNELILSRDGLDPLNAFAATPVALPLPGVPGVPSDPTTSGMTTQYGSVPFRGLSYVAPNLGSTGSSIWPDGADQNKAAHTLLRHNVFNESGVFPSRPAVPTAIDELGLFEARPTGDIPNDTVDYHTRNRLLAKVANHTTNRSNVFVVWLTVGYFEAHQPDPSDPTVVQIGGELAGGPRHRSFFVVDRTRLEEAVEVDDAGTPLDTTDDVMTLNWRSLLLHRRTLPEK